MLKKDFWYDLPKELIAQEPADPRDAARLMVLDRQNDSIVHSVFHDLPQFLEKGDLLVVNNSKVLPARLMGTKVPTGAVCELLLLRQVKGDTWECLARPGKRMQAGTKVEFGDGSLTAVVTRLCPTATNMLPLPMTPKRCMRSWTSSARCRCRPTSPNNWRTRANTRLFTPRSWAAQPPPRPACTSPRS